MAILLSPALTPLVVPTHAAEIPDVASIVSDVAKLRAVGGPSAAPHLDNLERALELASLATRVQEITEAADGTEVIDHGGA